MAFHLPTLFGWIKSLEFLSGQVFSGEFGDDRVVRVNNIANSHRSDLRNKLKCFPLLKSIISRKPFYEFNYGDTNAVH